MTERGMIAARRWTRAALAALVVGALAAGYALRRDGAPAPAVVLPPAARVPSRFVVPTDTTLVYEFAWRSSTHVALGSTLDATNDVELAGELALSAAGKVGSSTLVRAQIGALTKHDVRSLGADLLPDDAAARALFEGRDAILEIDPRGVIVRVHVPADAPVLYKHLAHGLLGRTQATLPSGDEAEWVATEAGDNGPVAYRYRRSGAAALTKGVEDPAVRARGDVSFDVSGNVEHQAQSVNVRSQRRAAIGQEGTTGGASMIEAEASFVRTLRARRPLDVVAVDLARYEAHAPAERAAAADERASLEQAAAGTTYADVVAIVSGYALGNAAERGAITRSTAFLLLHPEHCADLVRLFVNDSLGDRGRELVMDILASDGDDAAQTAMRAVLSTKGATHDSELFQRLLQRFALVDDPRAESFVLVEEVRKRAKAANEEHIYFASLFTLGALSGHAYERGKKELAAPVTSSLIGALAAPRDAREKRALLGALGNTGQREALAPIVAFAKAPESELRAQVATALRRFDDAEVRALLVEMVADADPRTGLSALGSLDRATLTTAEIARLAELVEQRKTRPDADARLIQFALAHAYAGDAARRILLALEQRGEGTETADNARAALAALAAQ